MFIAVFIYVVFIGFYRHLTTFYQDFYSYYELWIINDVICICLPQSCLALIILLLLYHPKTIGKQSNRVADNPHPRNNGSNMNRNNVNIGINENRNNNNNSNLLGDINVSNDNNNNNSNSSSRERTERERVSSRSLINSINSNYDNNNSNRIGVSLNQTQTQTQRPRHERQREREREREREGQERKQDRLDVKLRISLIISVVIATILNITILLSIGNGNGNGNGNNNNSMWIIQSIKYSFNIGIPRWIVFFINHLYNLFLYCIYFPLIIIISIMLILLIDLIFKCLYCQNYIHSLRLWLQGRWPFSMTNNMANNMANNMNNNMNNININININSNTNSSSNTSISNTTSSVNTVQQITMRQREIDYKEDFTEFDRRNSSNNNNNTNNTNINIGINNNDVESNLISPLSSEQEWSLRVSHCQRWFLFITSICILYYVFYLIPHVSRSIKKNYFDDIVKFLILFTIVIKSIIKSFARSFDKLRLVNAKYYIRNRNRNRNDNNLSEPILLFDNNSSYNNDNSSLIMFENNNGYNGIIETVLNYVKLILFSSIDKNVSFELIIEFWISFGYWSLFRYFTIIVSVSNFANNKNDNRHEFLTMIFYHLCCELFLSFITMTEIFFYYLQKFKNSYYFEFSNVNNNYILYRKTNYNQYKNCCTIDICARIICSIFTLIITFCYVSQTLILNIIKENEKLKFSSTTTNDIIINISQEETQEVPVEEEEKVYDLNEFSNNVKKCWFEWHWSMWCLAVSMAAEFLLYFLIGLWLKIQHESNLFDASLILYKESNGFAIYFVVFLCLAIYYSIL